MAEPGRVLAIDYGTRRVGLALSDPLRVLARGAGTLDNDGTLLSAIGALVRAEGVVRIVVGMPYAPDGGPGATGERVERFVRELHQAVNVPIEPWDESYSSVHAADAHRTGGMKRKQRREKGRIDEMAARLILQEYLDATGEGIQKQ